VVSFGLLWTEMAQLLNAVLLIVGALLPVVNPLGNVPIFLTLTHGCDAATRRDLARHIALYSFALLLGSMLLGSFVLRLFDLSIPVVQVAGGAVVIALGWHLLHYERPAAEDPPDPDAARQVAVARAFYPLTLPVSIDAGVIAVAITLGANHGQTLERDLLQAAAAVLGSAIVAASLLLAYRYAMRVGGWLGTKGMEMFLRLSALIVLSIGVQIVWNGVKSLLAEIGIGAA
jgi:multiple antibiotic resistance protein